MHASQTVLAAFAIGCAASEGASSSSGSGNGSGNGGAGGSTATSTMASTGGAGTGGCPTSYLGSDVPEPITYTSTTVGKPNIVESQRLEWREAGDEALLYRVPVTRNYRFGLSEQPSSLGGCYASFREASGTFYDPSWCPAPGEVALIDGYVGAEKPAEMEPDVALTEGQELLIWYSCAYWSTPDEGPFVLTIDPP